METEKRFTTSENLVRRILLKWPIYQRYKVLLNEREQSDYVMFLQAFNMLSDEYKKLLLERYFKGTDIKITKYNRRKNLGPLLDYRTQINDYGHGLMKKQKKELNHAIGELKYYFSKLFGDDEPPHTEAETIHMNEFNEISMDYQLNYYDYLYPAGTSTEEKQNDILNGLTKEVDYKKTKMNARSILKGYKRLKDATGGVVTDLQPYTLTSEEKVQFHTRKLKAIEAFNEVTSVINSLEEDYRELLIHHFIHGRCYEDSQLMRNGKSMATYHRIISYGLVEFAKRFNNGEYVVYFEIGSES